MAISSEQPVFGPVTGADFQNAMNVRSVTDVPLVVDLDGTLLKVDTLAEGFIQFLSRHPLQALRALLSLGRGRAAFKAAIAEFAIPNVQTMPVNTCVLAAMRAAKGEQRRVFLATAADRHFAEAVAEAIGGFDGIFASENGVNLKGQAKADCLVAAFGAHGFDYIGNETSDLPIWRAARVALIAGARPRLARRLTNELPGAVTLSDVAFEIKPYLLALRPHQWLKNGLVALPAIAAHDFSLSVIITVLIAFASFSLGASSIYIVNDMLDLPHDRAHPEKRHRSLAAGLVPLTHAAMLFGVLAAASISLALLLSWSFLVVLIGYFSLSLGYSLYLKRKLMIDVVALAALYGMRVVAGGAATDVMLSQWLLGFCFFIFLSLALVKRTAEMVDLPATTVGNIKGRGYRREDLQTITALTAASGFVAVLVLALYISSAEVSSLYHHPELLWGICVILVYWLGRICFLTGRGEMQQDPVTFAATDWISLLSGVLVGAVFLLAI